MEYLNQLLNNFVALGGWSLTSKVPLRYAKRFIEVVSNQSNYKRTKHSDMHLASQKQTFRKENLQLARR